MNLSRRQLARASVAAGTLAALALLGVEPAAIGRPTAPAASTSATGARLPNDADAIVHVLNRLGYGPRPGEIDRVRAMGLAAYIEQQLHPERLADTAVAERLASYTTLTMSTWELAEKYFIPSLLERRARQGGSPNQPPAPAPPRPQDPQMAVNPATMAPPPGPAEQRRRAVLGELAQARLVRAVHGERQLEEVMVDFWFNHFNVFAGKGATSQYLTEYERDVLRPHAFGKFRDLLGAVAQSPAMLFYLDNWMSVDPDAARRFGRGAFGPLPGNPGRRPGAPPRPPGVPDRPGSAGQAGGDMGRGVPAQPPQRPQQGLNENYARELLELHTLGVDGGYTQKDVQEVARAFTGWTIDQPRRGGAFRFNPRVHDRDEKVVLGRTLKGGRGREDGDEVLDLVAAHPSTARFIATKLARRFVADEPPKSLVDKAAARFTATGGDIREVVRTIVTSDEFFAKQARRAKVKTPLEFVVSAARTTGARLDNAMPVVQALRQLGMPLYGAQPPTGYADRADAWVNTGALVARMNFAVALVSNRLRGVSVDLQSLVGAGEDLDRARDRFVRSLLATEPSAATLATVRKAEALPQLAALTIGAPEFQRR